MIIRSSPDFSAAYIGEVVEMPAWEGLRPRTPEPFIKYGGKFDRA